MDELFLTQLAADGQRMVALATQGLDPISPCTGWTVQELLVHTGSVHRWAERIVSTPLTDWKAVGALGEEPAGGVVDWFSEGHQRLVETLVVAPEDLECVTFLRAPTPRYHWRRRQAHETAIHRVDLEEALGLPSAFDPDFADDGIDELLTAFMTRPERGPRMPKETKLLVEATDTGSAWLATIGPDACAAKRGSGPADVTVQGSAADLYIGLWNRGDADRLNETGPPELMQHWRTEMKL